MSRYASLPPLLLIAAILTAACGGSSSGSDPGANASKQGNALAYSQCMRSHGVPNFPDPGNNGHGGIMIQASQKAGSGTSMKVNGVPVSAPAFQSAMRTCRHYLPNGGVPTAAETAKARAGALAWARCVRSHGVPDFPDPTFKSGPGGGLGMQFAVPGVDKSSPAFQAAMKACRSLLGDSAPIATQAGR